MKARAMGSTHKPRVLSPRQVKLVKLTHVVSAAGWLGGTLAGSLALLRVQNLSRDSPTYTDAFALLHYIDAAIFIPAGLLLLATGAIYGAFTRWGFLKHWWIVAKWILTVLVIALGFVFYFTGVTFIVLQATLILGIMGLSVYKPRSRRKPLTKPSMY